MAIAITRKISYFFSALSVTLRFKSNLFNHRGTEKPVRPSPKGRRQGRCGSPTCVPTGILLRAASPVLRSNWRDTEVRS
ncbi:hypothetical protein [Nostoc sp.]|uniref:hypothetical protein n=1 Tax=Nostoc sp. TaxID=1180 RepID=UPI002FF4EEA7